MVELIVCDNVLEILKQIVDEKCRSGDEEACRRGREILDDYSCDEEWMDAVKKYVEQYAEEYLEDIAEYLG